MKHISLSAVVVALAVTLPARAQNPAREDTKGFQKSSPKVLAAFRDSVAKARQSTVSVKCDGKEAALGTVVGADGWILTKASELKGKLVCKLADGRDCEAKLVGQQDAYDLALLKVEVKGLKPVEFADSKQTPVGFWVASAGLTEDPLAVGVVSVAARAGNPREATLPATPPPNAGYLGVLLEQADEAGALKVTDVRPDTPASKAGLKINDLILKLGGTTVSDVDTFTGTLMKMKAGDEITLQIRRDREEKELKATLARRPASASRGDVQNRMGGDLSNRRLGFPKFLQHDTILKPTECGGPVVDLDGKVIGINIARAGRVESYAIPGESVAPLLFDLMSGKLPPKEVAAKAETPEEKMTRLKAAVAQAEADKIAAEKKLAQAREALQKAEAEPKPAPKPEEKK